MGDILVVAEHDHGEIKQGTLCAITAAKRLGGNIHVLVAGAEVASVVSAAAAIADVKKVLVADAPVYKHQLPEDIAPLAAGIARDEYDHVVAAATSVGKNLLPRVAALLNVAAVSDIIGVVGPDTFERPIYAGGAIATVQSLDPVKIVSVRATAFAASSRSGGSAVVETVGPAPERGLSKFVSVKLSASERPELTSARVVVSGGRGMQSAENFKLLEKLADKLGGAIGASRAAVDAGFASNDLQIGQTGKIVAPELYVAVGISGAIQHLAGMKDSKIIVAINKDADAPIFQVADYGLVADLFVALRELTDML